MYVYVFIYSQIIVIIYYCEYVFSNFVLNSKCKLPPMIVANYCIYKSNNYYEIEMASENVDVGFVCWITLEIFCTQTKVVVSPSWHINIFRLTQDFVKFENVCKKSLAAAWASKMFKRKWFGQFLRQPICRASNKRSFFAMISGEWSDSRNYGS